MSTNVLIALQFLTAFSTQFVTPLQSYFVTVSLRQTPRFMGAASASLGLCNIAGSVMCTAFLHNASLRDAILFILCLRCVAALCYLFAPFNAYFYLAARALHGLTLSSNSITLMCVSALDTARERGKATLQLNNALIAGITLGTMLGSAIGAVPMDTYSVAHSVFAALCVVVVVMVCRSWSQLPVCVQSLDNLSRGDQSATSIIASGVFIGASTLSMEVLAPWMATIQFHVPVERIWMLAVPMSISFVAASFLVAMAREWGVRWSSMIVVGAGLAVSTFGVGVEFATMSEAAFVVVTSLSGVCGSILINCYASILVERFPGTSWIPGFQAAQQCGRAIAPVLAAEWFESGGDVRRFYDSQLLCLLFAFLPRMLQPSLFHARVSAII